MFKTYAGAGPAAPMAAPASASSRGGWHPTVLYMLGLIVAEIIVAAFLSRHLLDR